MITLQIVAKTTQIKMEKVGGFSWSSYSEETDLDDKNTFTATTGLLEQVANVSRGLTDYKRNTFTVTGLLEQVNVTRDLTDYLWYTI